MGLEYEQFLCDAGYPLKRQHRVSHVIQHAEKQDHVKEADLIGCEFQHVDGLVLDLRAEDSSRELEPGLCAPVRSVPCERISGQHAGGTAPFSLKREEPVPRADIQDCLSVQV